MKELNIKKVIVLIIIVLIAIGIGYSIPKKNQEQTDENEAVQTAEQANETDQQVEQPKGQTEEKTENDKEKPADIVRVEISTENQIYAAAILNNFENGKNLTTDQYLEVVYNAICNGYIKIDSVKEKNEISKEQVNNIVYTMFGTELNENKSIDGMKYDNGMYKISPKKAGYVYMTENISRDSAAGTSYTEFDLYKEYASGQEEYMGKYTMSTVQNTVTGESYIKSFKKH